MFELERKNRRAEWVFMVLSGLFLGSLTMLNILGITKFISLDFVFFGNEIPFPIAIGVLAYPITFLCTDFISELFGKKRANMVVWMGLILNLWVLFIIWIGGVLPPGPELDDLGNVIPNTNGWIFYEVRTATFAATSASMIAYISAQFIDVQIFHYLKKKTGGKYLWLRNNGSTLVSQLVDSIAVILITHYYADALPKDAFGNITEPLIYFITASYLFKFVTSLLDTIPFYFGVKYLTQYIKAGHIEK
ncbi:queuosine precursor transporter [Crocinitomix catalasitica]|uniref:queuosine precursor transporter n=1 Tax=Crocinitomix catalasitica TaxID=184607 RepID=UPI00056B9EBD|nr:queuosine precursor transporter [Crocinitomix catalasitica]